MRPVLSHDPLSQHYNHIANNSKMILEVISVYSGIYIRVGSRLVHYSMLLTCQDRLGCSVTYLSGQVRLVSYLLVRTGWVCQSLTCQDRLGWSVIYLSRLVSLVSYLLVKPYGCSGVPPVVAKMFCQ